MHADIVTVPIQSGKIEEAVGVYRDVVAPLLKKQPGFKTFYMLRGSDPTKYVVVGLWDSKANSEAWENSEAYQGMRDKAGTFIAGPPVVEAYEVAVQA